jgi:uncharacterized membrane protein YdjX (TVP38/TMEM64 family)
MSRFLIDLVAMATTHPLRASVLFVVVRSLSVVYPPIPGFPMDLLGIRLFGATRAFLLGEVGIMLGATIAFSVGRLVRDNLPATKAQRLRELELRLETGGWLFEGADWWSEATAWGFLRLLTNPLFDPISYVAGLTGARFGPYFLGSLIGNAPSMALFYAAEKKAIAGGPFPMLVATALFIVCALHLTRRSLASRRSAQV